MTQQTETATNADDFSALLEDLKALGQGNADLTKALNAEPPKGDEKIIAAAEEAGVEGAGNGTPGDETAAGGSGGEGGEDGGEEEEDPILGKSFDITMEDGSIRKAYDGTEPMRRAFARMDKIEATQATIAAGQAQIMKALGTITDAVKGGQKIAGEQIALVKSMQTKLDGFGNAGVGRKATLSVLDRPTAAPAAPDPADARKAADDFMNKAMGLVGKPGGLTSSDIARIEAARGDVTKLSEALVNRVNAA